MLMNNTRAKLKSVQRGLPWAEQFIYSLAFGMLAVAVCLNTEAESDTVRVFPFCVCETNLLGLIVTWWVSVAWFKHIFFFFFFVLSRICALPLWLLVNNFIAFETLVHFNTWLESPELVVFTQMTIIKHFSTLSLPLPCSYAHCSANICSFFNIELKIHQNNKGQVVSALNIAGCRTSFLIYAFKNKTRIWEHMVSAKRPGGLRKALLVQFLELIIKSFPWPGVRAHRCCHFSFTTRPPQRSAI